MNVTGKKRGTPYDQTLEEERLILEATELIEELLDQKDINRKQLADRLGKSKAHVTQLLSGERNLTLRTLAELAYNLSHRLHLAVQPLEQSPNEWYARRRRKTDRDWDLEGIVRVDEDLWYLATGAGAGSGDARLPMRTVRVKASPTQSHQCRAHQQKAQERGRSEMPWMDIGGRGVRGDPAETCPV